MDTFLGLAAPFPNADATQEFRVITQNFDAQYGFSPGAVVNIQTKSGANALHGGVFEFVRNNDLNAANFFSHQVDTLKRNQFGGFAGGPIRKDRLFYFGNFQATRQTTAATANTAYTPTQAMLNGDFSALPTTLGGPFVNNKIDPATWATLVTNPDAPGYADYMIATTAMPLGQDPDTGKVMYTGPSLKQSTNEFTGRIDYTINDNQRAFVRSFVQYFTQPGAGLKGNIDGGAEAYNQQGRYYNGALGHTWMISPSTVNTLNVYYGQMGMNDTMQSLDQSGQAVCWSRYIDITQQNGHCDLQGLMINGGLNSNWGYYMMERRVTWGLSDQLSKTLGKHSVSAGFDLHRQFSGEDSEYPIAPVVFFQGVVTGSGIADFLLGDASYFNQGGGEVLELTGWQTGVYVQDQYKLRQNLTLTAGLRWDPGILPSLTGKNAATFIPGQQSTMFANAPLGVVFPGDSGVPNSIAPSTYNYFEPRIGFSWQPKFAPNTAIRGGFGYFTGPMPYIYYNHMVDTAPFSPNFVLAADSGIYPTSAVPVMNPYQMTVATARGAVLAGRDGPSLWLRDGQRVG